MRGRREADGKTRLPRRGIPEQTHFIFRLVKGGNTARVDSYWAVPHKRVGKEREAEMWRALKEKCSQILH